MKYASRRSNLLRVRKHEGLGFSIFVHIFMTVFILLCVLPFIHVIALSFSGAGYAIGLIPQGVTLYSYNVVFEDSGFFQAFGMSLMVAVVGTLLSVLVNFLAAYALSKRDLPFRRFFN